MNKVTRSARLDGDDRPRAVCHVITGLDTGGAEMMLYKLLTRIDRGLFPQRVISLTNVGPVGERIAALGIPVNALGMRKHITDVGAVARLIKEFKRSRPVIVQTWLYHADLVGGIAARLAGVGAKVVWNVRQSNLDREVNSRKTVILARLGGWLSNLIPDRIVCCARAVSDVHRKMGYAAGKLVVIPNGFDLERFAPDAAARSLIREELGVDDAIPLVGLIGRFDPQKDHHNFIQAAEGVAYAHPGARFVLAGQDVDWKNSALVNWVDAAGIRDRVYLLGRRDDIPSVLAALDVAVSASRGEGFANVIGEAMASGIPCVVTDVGDSAVVVGEAGRVVAPGDAERLAAAVIELLGWEPSRRAALGARARERVKNHYSLEASVDRYQALYAGL